jgi:UDP-MurNAc hydroxylase
VKTACSALHYVNSMGATHVVPSAGPPCFLDEELFHINDFDRDPSNQFPDQLVFIEHMQAHGFDHGHLTIPGSVMSFANGKLTVSHPLPDEDMRAIFMEKREYLEAYQARQQARIAAIKATWRRGQVDILTSLREWFEPLLRQADMLCIGVNGRVLLDCGDQQIMIDFQQRRVYAWAGEDWEYRFRTDAALVEQCILRHELDWTNLLFLSMRFQASRKGPFNEYIINFFNSLSPERIAFAERYHAERAPVGQLWEVAGYQVQRFCPHQKGDLTRFGRVENGILTCAVHGWEFELATGRCLTSDDRRLYARPIGGQPPAEEEASPAANPSPPTEPAQPSPVSDTHPKLPLTQCKDCTWLPASWREAPVSSAQSARSRANEPE